MPVTQDLVRAELAKLYRYNASLTTRAFTLMMNKQRLGWIGASIAAGIFPTFQMTFGPETLASPADPDGHGGDRAQEFQTDQISA